MTSRSSNRSGKALGRSLTLAFASVLVAGGLAACGSDGDSAPDTSNVDFDSLSMQQLYEKAKDEGKVVYGSGASDDDVKILADAFAKKYPGIEIQHYEAQGEETAAKITAEANAGVYETDILDTEQNTAYAMQDAGILAEYAPPGAAPFDDRLKQPAFTGYRIQIKVISYNTDKVSADEAPKTYDDLLAPQWKGKVCVEESEVSTFADMITDWGEDKTVDYWKQLTANGLRFVKGQSNLVESIVAGDCEISVASNVHSVLQSMADGAPIDWVHTDPMYANFGALGVLEHAPHPYAARLWINFLLSDEGQKSVAEDYRIPANPDVEPIEPTLKQGSFDMVLAGEDIMKNFTDYNNLWYTTTGRPVVSGG